MLFINNFINSLLVILATIPVTTSICRPHIFCHETLIGTVEPAMIESMLEKSILIESLGFEMNSGIEKTVQLCPKNHPLISNK